jgi:hypothetical protein
VIRDRLLESQVYINEFSMLSGRNPVVLGSGR